MTVALTLKSISYFGEYSDVGLFDLNAMSATEPLAHKGYSTVHASIESLLNRQLCLSTTVGALRITKKCIDECLYMPCLPLPVSDHNQVLNSTCLSVFVLAACLWF